MGCFDDKVLPKRDKNGEKDQMSLFVTQIFYVLHSIWRKGRPNSLLTADRGVILWAVHHR